ncbi:MAG TPA: response regulator transcription factor [Candidatus Elarobacter sp.]|nr:response regulator transcription factor [Candidatus Elarobacter sp.]
MLRKLRRPWLLERDEQAQALRTVLGTRSTCDAVRLLIDRGIRDLDERSQSIVLRCDVAGEGTAAVARDLYISNRQFFRNRATALDAIQAEYERLLAAKGHNVATRVLIADRRPIYAAALTTLLETDDEIRAVAIDAHTESIATAASRTQPDVVIFSGEPPRSSSLTAAREVRRSSPAVAVLLLVDEDRAAFTHQALAAGVRGMISSSVDPRRLVAAIRALAGGRTAFDPAFVPQASALQNGLSERELDVLRLAARGLSPHAISRSLGISKSTTRTYLSGAIRKTGAMNRDEAVATAQKVGWLS